MFFFFTCGTHTFSSRPKEAANIHNVRCMNCGNFSANVYKRWEWFTLCFVPIIPFSLKPHKEIGCHICRFYQDVKYRPDVEAQMHGGSQGVPMGAPPGQQQYK